MDMRFIVGVIFTLVVNTCLAEIYQWRDSSGNLHFSDTPPKEQNTSFDKLSIDDSRENVLFENLLKDKGKRVLKKVNGGNFYQYVPRNIDRAFAIVVVNHGMFADTENAKDAAYAASRRWQRFSEETGAIVIAPVFDNHQYAATKDGPQNWGYRGLFGRNIDADEFLNEIISYYEKANKFYDGKIFLSGHSAGAQFANRYLVKHPRRIHAAAFSAPAWFALPSYEHQWPNGMQRRHRIIRWAGDYKEKTIDIRPDPQGWIMAAQLPVTVVVGEHDLRRIRHVDGVGGDTHVARATYWVESMNQFASSNGYNGSVKLNIVEGVGHNFGKLAAVCQDVMRDQIIQYINNERKKLGHQN